MKSRYIILALGVLLSGTRLSAQETRPTHNIVAYPIPAQDYLNVEVKLQQEKQFRFILTNVEGNSLADTILASYKAGHQFVVEAIPNGVYTLTIKADKSISKKIVIDGSNSNNFTFYVFPEPQIEGIIGVSPNPTNGVQPTFSWAGSEEKITIEVYNLAGQIVDRLTQNKETYIGEFKLETSTYPSGIYIIKAEGRNFKDSIKLVVSD